MPEIIGNAGSTGQLAWIMWDDGTYTDLMSPAAAQALVASTPYGPKNNRGVKNSAMPTPDELYQRSQGPGEGPGYSGSPISGLSAQQIAQYNQAGLVDRNGVPVNDVAAQRILQDQKDAQDAAARAAAAPGTPAPAASPATVTGPKNAAADTSRFGYLDSSGQSAASGPTENVGSGAASNPQQPTYQTKNGPKTPVQIANELKAAGYPGPWDIDSMVQAYGAASGAPVTPTGAVSTAADTARSVAGNQNGGQPGTQAPGTQNGGAQNGSQTPDWYQQWLQAENERQIKEAEEEKRRWELQYALSKNADERAAAQLRINEAQQKLSEAQFKAQQSQFQQSLYSNLAQSLMTGASQLRGPRDYAAYQRYVGQGRSLMNQLFGDTRPAFGAQDSGYGGTYSIGDILGDLGVYGNGSGNLDANALIGANRVPTPQSINPANWDALSQSGRDLLLGLAEDPQYGGYDAADYQATINASRPMGQAPTGTRSRFANPTSVF